MFNFMVKEEPMGEDDMKVFKKDRVKKDNHNMSKGSHPEKKSASVWNFSKWP